MGQVSDCLWVQVGLPQPYGPDGDCSSLMGQVGTAPLIWARWGLPQFEGLCRDCPSLMGQVGLPQFEGLSRDIHQMVYGPKVGIAPV